MKLTQRLSSPLVILFLISILVGGAVYVTDNTSATSKNDPNVILVTLESTRADHLSCYGYDRNTTPNICKFAEDGVLFENAYSPGTSTTTSVPSIITSRIPSSVGFETWEQALPEKVETVTEVFNRSGWETAGMYTSTGNLEQGIEHEIHRWDLEEFLNNPERKDKLFLWWFLRRQAHTPYDPAKEYRKWSNISLNHSQLESLFQKGSHETQTKNFLNNTDFENKIQVLEDLYDGELLEADQKVKDLLDTLKENGIYEESLIIITSDHGEALGEHGNLNHGGLPFKEVSHVPLITKFPDGEFRGKRVDERISLVDIVPTLYDYTGIPIPEKLFGKTLIPTINDKGYNRTIVSGMTPHSDWGIIKGDHKYLLEETKRVCSGNLTGKYEERLFNIEKDQDENNNLISKKPEIAGELQGELCDIYMKGLSNRVEINDTELTEEMENRLKDMGYG